MRHERWLAMLLSAVAIAGASGCATDGSASRPSSRVDAASKENPDDPRTKTAKENTALGLGYMQQGKLEIALEKLNKALAADPKYPDANTVVAVLYERIGDLSRAEEHYRRAVQYRPKSGNENNNLGWFLCNRLARYDEAATHFERAVADPFYQTPVVALTNAGSCAIKGGKLDVAERDLRLALERGSNDPEALVQMATVLYRRDEFFKARAFIQRYESVGQQTADSLLLGRNIELRLGNAKAAVDYTKRLRDQFPESEQVRSLDTPALP